MCISIRLTVLPFMMNPKKFTGSFLNATFVPSANQEPSRGQGSRSTNMNMDIKLGNVTNSRIAPRQTHLGAGPNTPGEI
jgi:hypothetical protein